MAECMWEKTSAMSQSKNDFEGFWIMWDHFGIIWLCLWSIWKHLGACRVICDHLGSYASISAHLGIVCDHSGQDGVISKFIWDLLGEPYRRRILKKGMWRVFGKGSRSPQEAPCCNPLQNFHQNSQYRFVFGGKYHQVLYMVASGWNHRPKCLRIQNDSENMMNPRSGRAKIWTRRLWNRICMRKMTKCLKQFPMIFQYIFSPSGSPMCPHRCFSRRTLSWKA